MTGLFASFDVLPSAVGSIFFVLYMSTHLLKPMWVTSNRLEATLTGLARGFVNTLSGSWLKGRIIIFVALFSSILWFNWIGLFSYIFTNTGLISFTFSARSFVWIRLFMLTLRTNLGRFLRHLVPTGTPVFLIRFIVFIELIRNIIRPITLGVRLAANITAGHLLIALLASLDGWAASTRLQILLFSLEIAVGLIQAYVFALLRFLYFTEA